MSISASFKIQNERARDVTAAMLVFSNNEMAAILVSQTNPMGLQLCSYSNLSYCFRKTRQNPQAALMFLSCSTNFPRASITRYTHAKYELILNCFEDS